jgi:hypothetical protein
MAAEMDKYMKLPVEIKEERLKAALSHSNQCRSRLRLMLIGQRI